MVSLSHPSNLHHTTHDTTRQGITEGVFEEVIMETFTVLTTDDRTVELKVTNKLMFVYV